MEYKNFLDLTDDDVRQIVTDIFAPEKITCVKRSKERNEFSCKIYTTWGFESGDRVIADEVILRNPFTEGTDAIEVDFEVEEDDYEKLMQFCVSRGIYPDWFKNNPYMKEE